MGDSGGPEGAHAQLRRIWAASLQHPLPQVFRELGSLLGALHEARENISGELVKFLFGFESEVEKTVNDASHALRSSMDFIGSYVGYDGSAAEDLLGAAVERPPPHTRLKLSRTGARPVDVSASATEDVEAGSDLTTSILSRYTDTSVVATLAAVNPGAADGSSDLKVRVGIGSEEAAMRHALGVVVALQESMAWLASKDGSGKLLMAAMIATFPKLASIASRIVDVPKTRFSREEVRGGVVKISFKAPLHHDALQSHYPSLGDFLALFGPLLVRLRRPQDGAVFADASIQEGVIRSSFYFQDGQMVWFGKTVDPVRWDEAETFTVNAEVDFSLVPLGVSLAAVPFPAMKFQAVLQRKGSLVVTCIEASESQFENVASLAFDLDQFRRLLRQVFRAELNLVAPASDSEEWTIQALLRVSFPSASAVTALMQWFRSFIGGQASRMDGLIALADLSLALSQDAENMAKGA